MSKLLHTAIYTLRVVCFAALLLLVVDVAFVVGFPKESLPPAAKPADAVVVLGAAPNSPAIRNRATQGRGVYNEGYAKVIVLTGGNTSSKDESEAMNMARFLQARFGQSLPLVLEERSTNTYENLRNAHALVPNADSIVVVSDTYHVPRAFLTAKSLGFADVYWSSPDSSYYRPAELAWYYLREMVALVSYIPKWLHVTQ